MLFKVIHVSDPITKTGKNNKAYKIIDVTYQSGGKTYTKKLTSYSEVYDLFAASLPDQTYDVEVVKNEAGFNDWTSARSVGDSTDSSTEGTSEVQTRPESNYATVERKPFAKRPASTFESPEERAARQELIVRQSSLTNALAFCNANDAYGPNGSNVFQVAQSYRDWVYQVAEQRQVEAPTTPRAN